MKVSLIIGVTSKEALMRVFCRDVLAQTQCFCEQHSFRGIAHTQSRRLHFSSIIIDAQRIMLHKYAHIIMVKY